MIEVITPAAATNLTTLAAVKGALDIKEATHDAALSAMVGEASAALAIFTGRIFGRETVRETFRLARPVPSLVLSRAPVVSVSTVTEGATSLTTADHETDRAAGIVYRLTSAGRYLCLPAERVVVEYTAGWLLPGEAGRDLPPDVERACVALVVNWWHGRGRDRSVKSVQYAGGTEVQFGTAGTEANIPPDVAALIAPYRLESVG